MKLIDRYLPADYNDCVSKRISPATPLNPDRIFEQMFCNFPKPENVWQNVSVTTVVQFNNLLGRIYFAGIWAFHKILVKSLFRKAIK